MSVFDVVKNVTEYNI